MNITISARKVTLRNNFKERVEKNFLNSIGFLGIMQMLMLL